MFDDASAWRRNSRHFFHFAGAQRARCAHATRQTIARKVASEMARRRPFAALIDPLPRASLSAVFMTAGDLARRSRQPISERILVSRDRRSAAINPHRLIALARAVVGHAGSAPRRSRDLAALASGCLRRNAVIVRSRQNRNWRSKCGYEQQRCQKILHLHRSVPRLRAAHIDCSRPLGWMPAALETRSSSCARALTVK
jgi:hypothetical protein